MNRKELITTVNKIGVPLKQVAQETSIPLSALNKFWANKKELELMEMDGLVKWVDRRQKPPTTINAFVFSNDFPDENCVPINLPIQPTPWIKMIEDFCYENKITPEELIIGYVPRRVKPIPRNYGSQP